MLMSVAILPHADSRWPAVARSRAQGRGNALEVARVNRNSKLHESRIDWDTIKEDDFNRAVEVLLLKLHQPNAFVLDGRGGDKGIDVAVREDEKITTIYQLKHFREGFSGAWRKARGKQVRESFDSAWANHHHHLLKWVLVMPKNPTGGEEEFVRALGSDKAVQVDVWGQGKLDLALLDYPEIEQAVLRNDTVDLLRQMGLEKAALEGSDDLGERAEALIGLTTIRSDYWNTNLEVVDGIASESYVPKRPDAMEKEPIRTTLSLRFGPEHKDIQAKLRHALEFGSFNEINIPASSTSFTREGPSWVKSLPALKPGAAVAFVPQLDNPKTQELVTLNVIDENGFSKGRFEGRLQDRAHGTRGSSIKCIFANIVTGIFTMPHDLSEPGKFTYSYNLENRVIGDVVKALDMSRSLQAGAIVDTYFNGSFASKFQVGNDAPAMEINPFDEELVGDLQYLQQKISSAHFTYPAEITVQQRVMLRVARLLLEGFRTAMPPDTNLTATLSGEINDDLRKFVAKGGLFTSNPPAFTLEVKSSKYNLGPALMFHRDLEVVDREELLKALEAGTAKGMKMQMRPLGSEPIQVWLGHKTTPMQPAPEFRAWNLTDIDRPPSSEPS